MAPLSRAGWPAQCSGARMALPGSARVNWKRAEAAAPCWVEPGASLVAAPLLERTSARRVALARGSWASSASWPRAAKHAVAAEAALLSAWAWRWPAAALTQEPRPRGTASNGSPRFYLRFAAGTARPTLSADAHMYGTRRCGTSRVGSSARRARGSHSTPRCSWQVIADFTSAPRPLRCGWTRPAGACTSINALSSTGWLPRRYPCSTRRDRDRGHRGHE
jgi:hypothetical protein